MNFSLFVPRLQTTTEDYIKGNGIYERFKKE